MLQQLCHGGWLEWGCHLRSNEQGVSLICPASPAQPHPVTEPARPLALPRLASPALSGYITGQVIEVNGGQLMP